MNAALRLLTRAGANADTGCLSFTIPHYAYLLTPQQVRAIQTILKGQQESVFFEQDTQIITVLFSVRSCLTSCLHRCSDVWQRGVKLCWNTSA